MNMSGTGDGLYNEDWLVDQAHPKGIQDAVTDLAGQRHDVGFFGAGQHSP